MRRLTMFIFVVVVGAMTVLVWPDAGITAADPGDGVCSALPASAFVIGNENATPGTSVEFWGAQWSGQNSLTFGPAPDSFKGFADTVTSSPSAGFVTSPGNSSNPPTSLGGTPTITVLVTDSVSKSGPVVFGDVIAVAQVLPDPGYAPDPGHAGTGTVVTETFCSRRRYRRLGHPAHSATVEFSTAPHCEAQPFR